jgi:hypothetical protein
MRLRIKHEQTGFSEDTTVPARVPAPGNRRKTPDV